jgi:hypothetical protein
VAGPQLQVEGPASFVAARILNGSAIDLNSLEGIDTASIPNRSICYVRENERLYRWFQESVAAPAPPDVVQPNFGGVLQPGRWIIEPSGGLDGSNGAQILNFVPGTSIPGTNVATPLEFNTTSYANPASMADLPNNRLVVPAPGLYIVTLWAFFTGGVPTIDRSLGLLPRLAIQVNGGDNASLHADFIEGTVSSLLVLNTNVLLTATASLPLVPALTCLARLSAQLVGRT